VCVCVCVQDRERREREKREESVTNRDFNNVGVTWLQREISVLIPYSADACRDVHVC